MNIPMNERLFSSNSLIHSFSKTIKDLYKYQLTEAL